MVDFLLYMFDGDVGLMIFGFAGLIMGIAYLTERWLVDWAVGRLNEFKKRKKK